MERQGKLPSNQIGGKLRRWCSRIIKFNRRKKSRVAIDKEASEVSGIPVYLCDDVVEDILSRLPVLDLDRCKCVSKYWHSRLVPSAFSHRPNIAYTLIDRDRNYTWLVTFLSFSSHGSPSRDLFPPPAFNFSVPMTQILALCNGMVLACTIPFISSQTPLQNRSTVNKYVVLNPVTRRISIFAPPPDKYACSFRFNLLIFDPLTSSQNFAVIGCCFPLPESPFLYSSNSGEWQPLKLSTNLPTFTHSFHFSEKCSHFLNKICYKIYGSTNSKNIIVANIIAFDTEKEQLLTITSPPHKIITSAPHKPDDGYAYLIGVSADHLCYAFHDYNLQSISIWALKDCGLESWSLRHRVAELGYESPFSGRSSCVYALHPTDADLIFVSFLGSFVLLNLKTSDHVRQFEGDESSYRAVCPYVVNWPNVFY